MADGSVKLVEFDDSGTTYRVRWCNRADAQYHLEIEMRVGSEWFLCATGAWTMLEDVVLDECPILPPSHVLDHVAGLIEAES